MLTIWKTQSRDILLASMLRKYEVLQARLFLSCFIRLKLKLLPPCMNPMWVSIIKTRQEIRDVIDCIITLQDVYSR